MIEFPFWITNASWVSPPYSVGEENKFPDRNVLSNTWKSPSTVLSTLITCRLPKSVPLIMTSPIKSTALPPGLTTGLSMCSPVFAVPENTNHGSFPNSSNMPASTMVPPWSCALLADIITIPKCGWYFKLLSCSLPPTVGQAVPEAIIV